MAEYDSYIDSQIPYVGAIPSHWKTAPNKRVMHKEKRICDSYAGQDIISLTMKGAIVRDLGAGGKMPTTFDGYQFVYPGELLMCLFDIDVTPRCVGRVYNEGLTSPAYSSFVLHDNADLGYFFYYYLMLDHTKELLHLAKNLRHSLTEEQLGQIKVPLPPLEEQAAIATYLDRETERIDAIIAEAKASIEEYKAWKASIIYEAVTKGLNPNAEMKDSGVEWIGNIPQLFHVCKIKTLAKRINVGVVIRPSEYFDENGTVPFLRGLNIKEFRISDENMIFTNDEFNAQLSKSIIHTDDVLIVRDGSIGTACVVSPKYDGANVVSLIIVTPNDNTSSQYLCYCLNSLVCKRQFDLTKIGSALTHTSVSAVSNILVTIPPLEMQNEIVSHLDSQCGRIDLLINEKEALVTDLEAYKKSLIFEVVTGKRKVV